tara:strand:+ start:6124 stop:7500 length:1377 start_codon:yes stop_codon:yes gene_type:complete
MATVATMAVNVIARTGDFDKKLDSAGKKAKGFGSGIGGAMKAAISPAALAVAAIAAVGAALMKVNAAMERLDEVAKKSKSLGISGQDLMGFQHAAELAGVSAGGFSTAMQKMQKGIGEAMGGTGIAKDALADMGIELESFGALNADEQFLQLADKIAAVQNPAERAAMATAVFGRAGADMLPMLMQGRDAIEGQMESLKELQGELTDMDLKAIEDSNDAWTKVGKAFDGIWNQLSVMLAPAFEWLANTIVDVIKWVRGMVEWFKNLSGVWKMAIAVASPLVGAIMWVAGAWSEDEEIIEKVTKATEQNEAATLAAAAAEQKAIEEAAKAREALEQKGVKLAESLRTPMEMYNDTITDLNAMLDAGAISWETYGRAVEKAQDDIKKSEEFKAKEIKVAERQAVGVTLRGRGGFSIQQKQQRTLEKLREEEKQQLKQLKQQTQLLQQLNNNVQTGTVVSI